MNYISTRGYDRKYSAAEAIITGIAPDGGLFVPETIPQISAGEIEEMKNMQFFQISARVLSKYLTDFTEAELLEFAQAAYDEEKWGELQELCFGKVRQILGQQSSWSSHRLHMTRRSGARIRSRSYSSMHITTGSISSSSGTDLRAHSRMLPCRCSRTS